VVSGLMVHVVNILSDHCFKHPLLLHASQEVVGRVGPGIKKVRIEYLRNGLPRFQRMLAEIIDIKNGRII
jgi:hypothetical protein